MSTNEELAARLRNAAEDLGGSFSAVLREAADELGRLREGIRSALPDLLVVRESGDVFNAAWEELRALVEDDT